MSRDVIVWPIGRFKDMPSCMKPAFEKIEGGLPSVSYSNGKFYKILWVRLHPLEWPEKVAFELKPNDAIVLQSDGGVVARILGGIKYA